MVAHLLRLRASLLLNSYKRSTTALVLSILWWCSCAVLVSIAVGIAAFGAAASPAQIVETTVWIQSIAALAWLLVPLLLTGMEQTVSVRSLERFPLRVGTIQWAFLLSGICTGAGVATLLSGAALMFTWRREPTAAFTALLCAAAFAMFCVLASRVVLSVSEPLVVGRLGKVVSVVSLPLLLGLILVAPSVPALQPIAADGVAEVLAWTPLGVCAALPGDVASGAWGVALARTAVLCGSCVLLWLVWRALLARQLSGRTARRVVGARSRGLGTLRFAGRSAGAAVFARCLGFWYRDPRSLRTLVMAAALGLLYIGLSVLPSLEVEVSSDSTGDASSEVNLGLLALLAPFLMALILGSSLMNAVALDGKAFGMHVNAGIAGSADRFGRLCAALVYQLPLVLLGAVISAATSGTFAQLPGLLGASLCLLGAGNGISLVFSAFRVFPVQRIGDSPFKQPPSGGASTQLLNLLVILLGGLLMLPVGLCLVFGWLTESSGLIWLSFAVGALLCVGYSWLGCVWGGRIMDRNLPELMAQIHRAEALA